MMKRTHGKGELTALAALIGFAGLSISWSPAMAAEPADLQQYDHQGRKIFAAQLEITETNLTAGTTDRNLAEYYALRQYPGSPPRIPHPVDQAFSGNEMDCLSCHGKGGFSPEYGKFIPVTPHPENVLCYQCHAKVTTTELFVESDWQSVRPPRLGLSFLASSPPPVPHSLQMRENCIACHTGPAAVAEIQVEHAARGDCRQCHATVIQTVPFKSFKRK